MPDEIKVEQCDREAAAANILTRLKYEHGGEQPWMDASTMSMRMGEQDLHWEVQAFARHRIQHGAQSEPDLATIAYMSGAYDGRKDMEAQLAERDAEVARLREALVATEGAISEYYRYWTGGETRGSYDGKPERAGLWKAQQIARAALEAKP